MQVSLQVRKLCNGHRDITGSWLLKKNTLYNTIKVSLLPLLKSLYTLRCPGNNSALRCLRDSDARALNCILYLLRLDLTKFFATLLRAWMRYGFASNNLLSRLLMTSAHDNFSSSCSCRTCFYSSGSNYIKPGVTINLFFSAFLLHML